MMSDKRDQTAAGVFEMNFLSLMIVAGGGDRNQRWSTMEWVGGSVGFVVVENFLM
jgi:hypothetical protein